MKKELFLSSRIFIAFLLLLFISSCVPVEKLSYFNDIDQLEKPVVNPKTHKVILPFDRIYIRVLSIDPQTRQIFDMPEEVRYSDASSSIIGYLVDESGNIDFPFAGKINVGSLTVTEAAAKIQSALNEYVPNTTAVVKFIDNQVSVLGEVQQQGVYNFTQDKLNIYEALALGGGITRYGNRKNVVLIRQEGEKIMHHKLNLSDSKIASKDYYYVMPNDVIVVEPLKSVSSSYQNITYTTVLTSITTLVAVLLLFGVSYQ
jgi:polysaccharide export outer membrane protein